MAGPVERVYPPTAPRFGGGAPLSAPQQFELLGDETCSFQLAASVVATVDVSGRVRRPDGTMHIFRHSFRTIADRDLHNNPFTLERGTLLHLGATTNDNVKVGEVFTRCLLIQGTLPGGRQVGVILHGYVTHDQDLHWPGSPIRPSTEGPGALKSYLFGSAAAGAPHVVTVPTNLRWRLVAVSYDFSTLLGGPPDRLVHLRLQTPAAAVLFEIPSSLPQPNLSTFTHHFVHGVANILPAGWNSGLGSVPTLPALIEGFIIEGVARFQQPNDTFNSAHFLVEEWMEF